MIRILVLLLLTLPISSLAQEMDSLDFQTIRLVSFSPDDYPNPPYYVIIADQKQLGIAGELVQGQEYTLDFIDPEWIKKISFYIPEKAFPKYDSLGKNGVVEIEIKMENIKEIPPDILAKFVTIDN